MIGFRKITYVDGRERIVAAVEAIVPLTADPLTHIRFVNEDGDTVLSVAQVHVESIEVYTPEDA